MILICLFGVTLAALTACGQPKDDAEVVATTAIAADITRELAGKDVEVAQLLPGSASPHDYSPTAKDRAALEGAELVVAWGSGLEAGLSLEELEPYELARQDDDPHVWMDPTLVADALPELAEQLAAADPEHAEGYRARAEDYSRRLTALDARIEDVLARVPRERRKLVTSHDSLGHFAERYGFEFVGAPFGLAPEAEPSAETVARLIDDIESEGVPAVFAERSDNPSLLRRIADETGVSVVDDLLVEGFADGTDSYEALLLYDAQRIARALGG